MDLGEIISDAIRYPTLDFEKLLILGVILVITNLADILLGFGVYNEILSLVLGIVTIIFCLIILGYCLDVIKNGIDLRDEIPDFDWVTNFVDGIKTFVLSFIYMIIPIIIVALVGLASLIPVLSSIDYDALANISSTSISPEVITSAIPESTFAAFGAAIIVVVIVAIILFLIFEIFQIIGLARLANTGSLGEGLSIGAVYREAREIGILKIIGWIILTWIIAIIFGLVIAVIASIPFVGAIIASLIFYPFLLLFQFRAVGLLYSEI